MYKRLKIKLKIPSKFPYETQQRDIQSTSILKMKKKMNNYFPRKIVELL